MAAVGLRAGLPYGAVMATGGTAQLTRACGLGALAQPLVWLALAQAAWILVRGVYRHRAELHQSAAAWLRVGWPREHTGVLTVPLGLAVIASGLAAERGGGALAVGLTCLMLAWATTGVFVGRFTWALARHVRNRAVDGAWFLAPAALLGASVAAAAYVPRATGVGALLRICALVMALAGTAGYAAVVALAAGRALRSGLAGARPVLWTISAGCGGLAGAALARALLSGGARWGPSLSAVLRVAALTTWLVAAVLAVPILAQSARWLAGLRDLPVRLPWPPTFSAAVFALGALAVGTVTNDSVLSAIGRASAYATVAFWSLTAASYVYALRRRGASAHHQQPVRAPNTVNDSSARKRCL